MILKLIIFLVCSCSSIVLLIYTIKKNKPKFTGEFLTYIYIPEGNLLQNNSIIIVYPVISNVGKHDNTLLDFELSIDCGMGYFNPTTVNNLDSNKAPDYYVIPDELSQTILLVDVKKKILKSGLLVPSGECRHGYLFYALSKGFFFENIIKLRLTVTDSFFNKHIINSSSVVNDVKLFLQKSNAKFFGKSEKNDLKEMIKKLYC